MNDLHKTHAQLIAELTQLRERVAELETVQAACQRAAEALRMSEERLRMGLNRGACQTSPDELAPFRPFLLHVQS